MTSLLEQGSACAQPHPRDIQQELGLLGLHRESPTPWMIRVYNLLEPVAGNRTPRMAFSDDLYSFLIACARSGLFDDMEKIYGNRRADVMLAYFTSEKSINDPELKQLAGVGTKQRVSQLIRGSMTWLFNNLPEDYQGNYRLEELLASLSERSRQALLDDWEKDKTTGQRRLAISNGLQRRREAMKSTPGR